MLGEAKHGPPKLFLAVCFRFIYFKLYYFHNSLLIFPTIIIFQNKLAVMDRNPKEPKIY